jgi:hypothetical protein
VFVGFDGRDVDEQMKSLDEGLDRELEAGDMYLSS